MSIKRIVGSGLAVVVVACGAHGPTTGFGEDDDAGVSGTGEPVAGAVGAGGTSTAAGPVGSGAGAGAEGATGATSGNGATTSSGAGGSTGTGSGGSGGIGPGGCYEEGFDPAVSLSDLQSSYQGSQWLPTMLEVLDRRYHNGWYVLNAMKDDPWLTGQFPQYFSLNSWSGMIDALDTACHEETHGYDFDQALNMPNQHLYYMGSNLQQAVPKLAFFPRSEILSHVQQSGSVTSSYDSTYLTGTSGSYDFIFLGDELTAYIIGLACATAVGEQFGGSGYSYRDGVASHLYYLQAYLKVARAEHPTLYNQWKADSSWQSFVRFSWARGHYWTEQSQVFPNLGINDAAIWSRINDADNLQEIELFTGDDPAAVACSP